MDESMKNPLESFPTLKQKKIRFNLGNKMFSSKPRTARFSKCMSTGNVKKSNDYSLEANEKARTMKDDSQKESLERQGAITLTESKNNSRSRKLMQKIKTIWISTLKRKLTASVITTVSGKFKNIRIITYIRKNFQKITCLSENYRYRNLNAFHHYLIGDLATDALTGSEKNFQNRLNKAQKRIERVKSAFPTQGLFLEEDSRSLAESRFDILYLRIYNNLFKFFNPIRNRLIQLQKLIRRTFKVIPPNSPLRISYDIYSFFMIIFTLLFLPLHNIFWAHQSMNFLPLLMIVIFFGTEILMSFNIAYIKNGIIYYERSKIFWNSFNIQKGLDALFLYFSLETLTFNRNLESEDTHMINIQITNILLVYKVFRLSEIFSYIEDFVLNLNENTSIIVRMIKLLGFNFICAHLIACCWISISFYEKQNKNALNWAVDFTMGSTHWFKIYIYGLYWAVTTMLTVGYGDITGTTNLEIFFSIVAMIFSCCLYGYTMNTVGVILRDYNNQERHLKKQQNVINFLLKEKGVDAKLQLKIKKYLVDVWEAKKRNMITTQDLIEMIPSDYKLELLLQIYGRAMLKNKVIFRLFGLKALKKLCLLCTEKIFLPNEIIYAENSIDNRGCFFVERGRVELSLRKDSQIFLLNILSEENWFGEYSFFTSMPRAESVKSIKYTSTITIEQEDLLQVLKEFPKAYEKFCFVRDKILLYDIYCDISLYCISCSSSEHLTNNCSLITYYPKRSVFLRNCYERANTARGLFNRGEFKTANARKMFPKVKKRLEDFIERYPEEVKSFGLFAKMNDKTDTFSWLSLTMNDYEDLENHQAGAPKSKIFDEEKRTLSAKRVLWGDFKEEEQKIEDLHEFSLGMDKMKNWKLYFPKNNYSNVIKKINSNNQIYFG